MLRGLHPRRLRCALEPRRRNLGLPVSRLPIRPLRPRRQWPGEYESEAPRRRLITPHAKPARSLQPAQPLSIWLPHDAISVDTHLQPAKHGAISVDQKHGASASVFFGDSMNRSFEMLESRTMLSAAALTDGTLLITGDNGVTNQISVALNADGINLDVSLASN